MVQADERAGSQAGGWTGGVALTSRAGHDVTTYTHTHTELLTLTFEKKYIKYFKLV